MPIGLGACAMFKLLRSLFQLQGSEVSIQRSDLGVLKLDGSLWSGAVVRNGRKIKLWIAGTRLGPDDRLVASVKEVLQQFAELESAARAFVTSHDSRIDATLFTFCSINVLWRKRPECYYFEYQMVGDENGTWRVEFEGVEPKHLGRDDKLLNQNRYSRILDNPDRQH